MKTIGLSARPTLIRPAPSIRTEASVVRLVSPQAGPAVDISADLTCGALQAGCRWRSRAAAPETCGAAMLVPSKTANGSPIVSRSVDERMEPPGAERSGLRSWPNGVRPAEEKLIGVPPRPVSISSGSRPMRTVARPPVAVSAARRRAPSASAIIPAGIGGWIGTPVASPGRLSTYTMPSAPAAFARSDFEMKVQ